MEHELIETLENMMNGDATSDIRTFNAFVLDFIDYMENTYDMKSEDVLEECGLVAWSDRK